ncbi:MAG: YqjF family protein, partial [Pyrinomonadaceae bacterium]
MKKFLTAEWRDLIMVNYEIDPSLVASRVPRGTELDLYDGKCFVSLVGFMFLDTRVLGFLVPFHVNFEEVNLRFYVRRDTGDEIRRGVVFIKEIVPRSAIAAVARTMYGEPYEAMRMDHIRADSRVGYSWYKGENKNRIEIEADSSLGVPDEGSHGSFIIEHYWGYTRRNADRTDEYKVEHPKWELFSASNTEMSVDFGGTYGTEFAFLSDTKPYSV